MRNRPEWDLEGQAEARTNSLASKREAMKMSKWSRKEPMM